MNWIGKRVLIGAVLAGTLGLGTSAMAQDGHWRDVQHDRVDVRHDFRDAHRDRVAINHDRRELRRDQRLGFYGAASHERRELAAERHDLRHDRRDIRHDRRDVYRDRH